VLAARDALAHHRLPDTVERRDLGTDQPRRAVWPAAGEARA
jgi:hypothetical protein